MALIVVPMGVREAQGFIEKHHSHHHAPSGGKFAVAVAEVEGGG